jgi:hypothetical protein
MIRQIDCLIDKVSSLTRLKDLQRELTLTSNKVTIANLSAD